jgi:hypothetical protein
MGGASEGKEKQLKAILIKHKKVIGWTEEEFKHKLAIERGKAKKAKKGKAGRPKKYHSPSERKMAKAEGQRKRAKEARGK